MSSAARALGASLTVVLLGVSAWGCSPSGSSSASGTTAGSDRSCPTTPDPAKFADAAQLKAMNTMLADLGPRPTGSEAQAKYVDWIESRLKAIDGAQVSSHSFAIQRWSAQSATLSLRVGDTWRNLPVAAPIHYAQGTPKGGVTAPLVAIPDDEPITAAGAAGRIVVRPAPAGAVVQSVFTLPLVTWSTYDPHHTIDPKADFLGDFLNYKARVADLDAAAKAGAAGIVFVKDLPRAQIAGHIEPYEGVVSPTPGVWLGVDEGKVLADALVAGASPVARLTVAATVTRARTKSLFVTIPGTSPQRLVIDSHTDGTNAVEDNGPIAMIAMARYFAALPTRCRPRTIELSFSTAHFYQRLVGPTIRNGAAEWLARRLDADYAKGSVAGVLVLEHLGSREYAPVPRQAGSGDELTLTGEPTIQQVFVTPSEPLVHAVDAVVEHYDLDRTVVMKGADVPGKTAPAQCDFGGEGTPFDQRLLPTVGVISAPQSLYDPAFGIEGVDFARMHAQLLAFTDLVSRMGRMSTEEIAGSVPAERARRAHGAAECST